uniref:Neuregulin C-terminal domain-containing protein n=1 Tax=Lepisosteus oculatus TaxID=7918 RepID=W5N5L4_LEPOC
MESEEVYKRQVLSISCIAIGISLLGTLCVAFYCRNKRQREKLQAHLKESRSLKSYSANMSGLMSKTSLRPQCGLQLQSYCKGHGSSPTLGGSVRESSFSQSRAAPPCHSRVPATGKPHSPDQRSRPIHRSAPRRTPPLTRGRLNPIGGTRDSGPAYQHLQEVELSEREAETQRGLENQSARAGGDPSQDIFLNMQPPLFAPVGVGEAKTEVQCSRLDRAAPGSIKGTPFGHGTPPPPVRACSIPIIPSVLGQDDISCMQKGDISEGSCSSMPLPCLLSSVVDSIHGAHTPPSPAAVIIAGGQQEAVALLLEAAQEQLRVLAHAHRKLEDSSPSPMMACETACFLSPITAGGVPQTNPPETQLMNPSEPHRDSSQPCQ